MKRDRTPDYIKGNTDAATVILADVAQYGGPESGLVRWAERHLARHGQQHAAAVSSGGIVVQQHGEQMALGFDEQNANGINTLGPGYSGRAQVA